MDLWRLTIELTFAKIIRYSYLNISAPLYEVEF
nr:MAG TPA: hypothetical protein [Caudoviricetes sp.]